MIDSGEILRKLALNVARYSGLAPLARPWLGGIGAILMLHRVTAAPGKPLGVNRHLNIAPRFLDALISGMKRDGYAFVTMDEAVERVKAGEGGRRFAAITADDAYRDNLTEALPVLEKHSAPLTIYVAPGLINGEVDLWWDLVEDIVAASDQLYLATRDGKVAIDCSTEARKFDANIRLHGYLTNEIAEEDQGAVVRDLARSAGVDFEAPRRETLLTWDEIRHIARHPLVSIGAHTVHHYNLRRLSEEAALREIADAGRILKRELGETPRHMAFPYGYESAVGPREVRLAGETGFVSAVTTRHGVLRAGHAGHLHALPRISVNGRYQNVAHIRTMLTGVTTPMANRGRVMVTV
jgi:peptidoglycan/xylan/chitin deacetylase (PgdA/CDA1 family)